MTTPCQAGCPFAYFPDHPEVKRNVDHGLGVVVGRLGTRQITDCRGRGQTHRLVATVVSVWLAALLVGVAVLIVAGVVALMG